MCLFRTRTAFVSRTYRGEEKYGLRAGVPAMTVRYDRNATFLGVPMTRVRNFLRRWQYRNLRYIGKLKDVDLDFRAVSVVADELTRQGMVGAVGDGLTRLPATRGDRKRRGPDAGFPHCRPSRAPGPTILFGISWQGVPS